MAAARCPDCGAVTVKDHAGLWVLRHTPGCEELDGPPDCSFAGEEHELPIDRAHPDYADDPWGGRRVCMVCGEPANVSVCDRCCE